MSNENKTVCDCFSCALRRKNISLYITLKDSAETSLFGDFIFGTNTAMNLVLFI